MSFLRIIKTFFSIGAENSLSFILIAVALSIRLSRSLAFLHRRLLLHIFDAFGLLFLLTL